MKKIKILLIGMSSNLGGIETYLYNLYKNADKSKFHFDFTNVTEDDIVYKKELEKDGCKVFKLTPRYKNYKKHIENLKNIFLHNDYDYVHYNIMSYSWYEPIVIANKYSKAKIIIHSHCGSSNYLKGNHLRTTILNLIGKYKTRKISYIRAACGKQAGDYMFRRKDYLIFNNGIDLEKFKFNEKYRKEIRESLNIDNNTTIYGLVAAFFPVKNHEFLIDIFYKILKSNSNSKLLLIGQGPTQEQIINKVKNLKIEDKVLFLGKRTDVNKIYSALDTYIMPSITEGLSISLIEAQVNGLKCYTSDGVDKNSNITGNVEFLDLKKPAIEWAKIILNFNNKRDSKVLDKVPEEFNAIKSYEKVFNYYKDNIK